MSKQEKPKYRKRMTRVKVALALYYGTGDDDPWSLDDIAEHLRVSRSTVEDYIYESDISEEVEDALAEAQARTRMEIVMKLKKELRKLEDIEQQLLQAKETVISSYTPKTVEVKLNSPEGVHFDNDAEAPVISTQVPMPADYKEVPDTSKLKGVWIQKRKIIQDIEDLMGLEAPDKVQKDERRVTMEKKVYEIRGGDNFPKSEVRHADERIEEEGSDVEVTSPHETEQ